jgi:predicted TIM-barrel fold metal-dependent hydrolase
MPALLWRMDRAWRLMGKDTTHLDSPPSSLLRDHFWFTTQPIDEPDRPEQFVDMLRHLEHLGMGERVMFSTDYPHWDFDSPERAFPDVVDRRIRENVFLNNARKLYRFEKSEEGVHA